MSDSNGTSRTSARRPATEAAAGEPSREKTSGRIVFDARGNAAWEWRQDDGNFGSDASTTLVQRLEAPELQIEPTVIVRQSETAPSVKTALPCGGFNPYDSATIGAGAKPAAPAPRRAVPNPPPVVPAVDKSRRNAGFLQRLQNWRGKSGRSGRR